MRWWLLIGLGLLAFWFWTNHVKNSDPTTSPAVVGSAIKKVWSNSSFVKGFGQ